MDISWFPAQEEMFQGLNSELRTQNSELRRTWVHSSSVLCVYFAYMYMFMYIADGVLYARYKGRRVDGALLPGPLGATNSLRGVLDSDAA